MGGPRYPGIFLSALLLATWSLAAGQAYSLSDAPPALDYRLSDPCDLAGGRAIGSDFVEDFARPIPAPQSIILVLLGLACLVWWRPRQS
jgi:hypothetical protein